MRLVRGEMGARLLIHNNEKQLFKHLLCVSPHAAPLLSMINSVGGCYTAPTDSVQLNNTRATLTNCARIQAGDGAACYSQITAGSSR